MLKKFNIITLILAIVCAFSLVACGEPEEPTTPTTPTLSVTEAQVKLGETFTLEVKDFEGDVEWSVGDSKIVTVENGVVTGVGIGETKVVCIVGEVLLTCQVTCTIDYVEIPRVVLQGEVKDNNGYVITLKNGGSYELTPALIKENKAVENVTFTLTSDNEAVTTNGTTVNAVSAHNGVKVTISCVLDGTTYSETLTVIVK